MSGMPLAERIARASAIRIARHEEAMAQLPFGLVPSTWLASISGLTLNTCKTRAMAAPVRLDAWNVRHWGHYPSTFGPWVASWGLDRVLEYLDRNDKARAAFLRANADGVHNAEADRAAWRKASRAKHDTPGRRKVRRLNEDPEKRAARIQKAAEAGGAQRVEDGRENRAVIFADVPVGLVPLRLCALVAKQNLSITRRRLDDLELPMVNGIGWPTPVGSWTRLITAWGVDKARAWVTQHTPHDLRTFERDVRGASRTNSTDILETLPVGLLPDAAFTSFGVTASAVAGWRERRKIRSQVGRGHRRFDAFVASVGREAARDWLLEHAPRLVTGFDADMARSDMRAEMKIVEVEEFVPAPLTETERRRRPPSPTPKEKPEPVRAHTVEEWIRAGGVVKKAPPMGWANPESPNYDPALVARKRAEERKKGWRR